MMVTSDDNGCCEYDLLSFLVAIPRLTVEQLEQQRELNKGLEMPLFWL